MALRLVNSPAYSLIITTFAVYLELNKQYSQLNITDNTHRNNCVSHTQFIDHTSIGSASKAGHIFIRIVCTQHTRTHTHRRVCCCFIIISRIRIPLTHTAHCAQHLDFGAFCLCVVSLLSLLNFMTTQQQVCVQHFCTRERWKKVKQCSMGQQCSRVDNLAADPLFL